MQNSKKCGSLVPSTKERLISGTTDHDHGDAVREGVRRDGETCCGGGRVPQRLHGPHQQTHDQVHRASRAPLQHPANVSAHNEITNARWISVKAADSCRAETEWVSGQIHCST